MLQKEYLGLRYLKGTIEHCVVYKSSGKGIEGFVDAVTQEKQMKGNLIQDTCLN